MSEFAKETYYCRQMLLPEFTGPSMTGLSHTHILVIGVGGVGCPFLQCSTALGIGFFDIVDSDTVSISNLARQTLFGQEDVGKWKVVVAAERLSERNPFVRIRPFVTQVDEATIMDILQRDDYDVAVDCTDNPSTRSCITKGISRYNMTNDKHMWLLNVCAEGWEVQVLATLPGVQEFPCRECIFGSAESPNLGVRPIIPVATGLAGVASSSLLLQLLLGNIKSTTLITGSGKATYLQTRTLGTRRKPMCGACREHTTERGEDG